MTRRFALPAFVLAALPFVLTWALAGRPVAVPDGAGQAIPCVSYTPFRGNETPFEESFVAAPERIADDLARLAAEGIRCVRTYSVDQGLERVPEIAARHGIAVMLGAWIGREEAKNRLQLETAVRLANAHPGTVRALIVGNEVLLRRERTADDLARALAWVRARVSVPLTYADVWEFWLRNPALAGAVDFVTVHVLPYWEDEPVANADAARYTVETWRRMREAFPGKSVFLGETGWPSAGRMRAGARPGRIEQARFLREFSVLAAREPGLDFNLIEAFDQPWKRAAEGTVGGHWGIFDESRRAKFPWTGPVAARTDWTDDLAATEVLALALYTLAFGRGLSFARWLALGIFAHAAAALFVVQAELVSVASRGPLEWAIGAGGLALGFVAAALAGFGLAHGFGGSARIAPVGAALAWLARPKAAAFDRALAFGIIRSAFLAAALVHTLGLLFDGRYRGFPVAGFLVPAAVFAGIAWFAGRTADSRADPQGRALALVLAIGGIAVALLEGWPNHQALLWAATALLLAAPWFIHRPAP
jgi:glucan 1,3-beta-glucosidase